MRNNIRVLYMGTTSFSASILEFLINEGVNIIGVVSQPDKIVGKKRLLEETPTKKIASKYNIEVFQPERIRNDYEFLVSKKPDIILTCAYGQIVPQAVLDIPKYKCINIHGSLLPKYRGAAPVQYAILNNENVTGITYMEMIKEMDAGQMYLKSEVNIDHFDTTDDVFDKLLEKVKETVIDFLDDFVEGKISGKEQNKDEVTFTKMINREDELIDWNDTNLNIHNKVRAFYHAPLAHTLLNGVEIKIIKGEDVKEKLATGKVGEIVLANKQGIFVQTGSGLYRIDVLQVSGKKAISSRDYLNGNKDLVGKMFYVK